MTRFGRERALEDVRRLDRPDRRGRSAPAPPRPQGIERNVVITAVELGRSVRHVHDEIADRSAATDAERATVRLRRRLDQRLADVGRSAEHTPPDRVKVPHGTAATKLQPTGLRRLPSLRQQAGLGEPASPAQPDDGRGGPRVDHGGASSAAEPGLVQAKDRPTSSRSTSRSRARACRRAVYDPKTKQFTLIDTCFGTHHLQFARRRATTRSYFSDPGGSTIGWINTKMFDKTKRRAGVPGLVSDRARHQRRRQDHQAVERAGGAARGSRDRRRGNRVDHATPASIPSWTRDWRSPAYGIIVNPVDGSIWGATDEVEVPGQIFRLELGEQSAGDLQDRALHPARESAAIGRAASTSTATASSGRRSQAAPTWRASIGGSARSSTGLNQPAAGTATRAGRFYKQPGPSLQGHRTSDADFNYYNWVDQFNTLGPGQQHPHRERVGLRRVARAQAGHRRMGHAAASRIRWASTAADSTAALTIRRRAGRDAASTPPSVRMRIGTSRVVPKRRAIWSSSRSGRTRSRSS